MYLLCIRQTFVRYSSDIQRTSTVKNAEYVADENHQNGCAKLNPLRFTETLYDTSDTSYNAC